MFGKLLCKIGLHDMRGGDKWLPDFHARIITRYESRYQCTRCGKVDEVVFTYDEITGEGLEIIQNGVARPMLEA